MPSAEPTAEVAHGIEVLLEHIRLVFKRLQLIRNDQSQLANAEREFLLKDLKSALRSIEWDFDDFAHTLSKLEESNTEYGISTKLIADRRRFFDNSKSFIEEIKLRLSSNDSCPADFSTAMAAISSYRYTRLDESPASSSQFVTETLQKQQEILSEQDRDLEKVGDSVHLLKNMSSRIGVELEEHAAMLDDMGTEMEKTKMKLDGIVKKIAKVTKMNDDRRQWTAIFVLSAILFFIILLFIIL